MKGSLLSSLLFAVAALCLPHGQNIDSSISPPGDARLQTVYQFPNETWVENIAVRKDGKLLVTIITSPEVYLVDSIKKTSTLVHRFPNATSTMGISETEDGCFVVAVGDWNPKTFEATPGSWSVWTIDFGKNDVAVVNKITDVPEAYFLNGLSTLTTQKNTVLIGDSGKGLIYRLNTRTKKYVTVIDSPALKPNASAIARLGVNGIHVENYKGREYLYFTNSFSDPFFGRIPLNVDGTASGPYETIVARPNFPLNNGAQADDFARDRYGNTWITSDPTNTLAKYDEATGKLTVVAGGNNEAVIAGDTAAAFGRRKEDRDVLYITTNGGIAYPPPGGVVGGKIVALDTKGL